METTVKLSRLEDALEELSYPVERELAAERLADVTVTYADGESNLGDIVADVGADRFDSVEDLRDEVYEYLPVEAVGEPGQSEGEG